MMVKVIARCLKAGGCEVRASLLLESSSRVTYNLQHWFLQGFHGLQQLGQQLQPAACVDFSS
jgi:hypothetical protein